MRRGACCADGSGVALILLLLFAAFWAMMVCDDYKTTIKTKDAAAYGLEVDNEIVAFIDLLPDADMAQEAGMTYLHARAGGADVGEAVHEARLTYTGARRF